MYKKVFTIDGFDYVYIGYTSGRRWNGWATPYFEFAEALEVMHDYNECTETSMQYDKVYDQFYILDKEDECIDRMQTVDSIIAQLKDFNTLKQAIRIFYNDDLTEELKFEKLGGILRV